CTIDPSVGIVPVPDPRLAALTELSKSAKTIPAVVEFVDIAGLVKGAADGAGLGNAFLAHIREVDAIVEVVRIFEDSDIIHVEAGMIDPVRDIDIVNLELVLSDLEAASTRLARVQRDAKRGEKEALAEAAALEKAKNALEGGHLASTAGLTTEESALLGNLHLLTLKPMMYVLNKKAGGHNLDEMNDARFARLTEYLGGMGATFVVVDAAIEGELRDVAGEDTQKLRQEFGVLDDGVDGLIRAGYDLLGLMTYFTTGPDETRAWTIPKGSTAPEAGAAIHTDFKDKFIRAEVVYYDDLVASGSFAKARERGLVRTEGKEYIVKDGDIVEFKI
ncbi:MAG: redox-regulated ATPase YchF, partial [Patescibacteria group bacterium]